MIPLWFLGGYQALQHSFAIDPLSAPGASRPYTSGGRHARLSCLPFAHRASDDRPSIAHGNRQGGNNRADLEAARQFHPGNQDRQLFRLSSIGV